MIVEQAKRMTTQRDIDQTLAAPGGGVASPCI